MIIIISLKNKYNGPSHFVEVELAAINQVHLLFEMYLFHILRNEPSKKGNFIMYVLNSGRNSIIFLLFSK